MTDLVQRQVSPDGPERIWVADITSIDTRKGWLYLGVSGSRRIDGWAVAPHLRTELVANA